MKSVILTVLRVLALGVAYTVLMTFGSGLTTPPEVAKMLTPEQTAQMLSLGPLVCLIMATMMAYLGLRSRWHGWKLAGALFLIYYILYSFLGWIEVLAFPAVGNRMPPGMLTSLLTTGLVIGIPFCLLEVWILGKTRADPAEAQLPPRFQMPASEWGWKIAGATVLYVIVYFTFGYYVAWRTPGLPAFYGGSDPGSYLAQLGNVLRDTPWLYPFQLVRGLIWTGTGLIILAMHKGRTWEAALATGLSFTVLMNAGMLLPNPFFTPVVQHAHTIELVSSNLLYGILLGLLMMWKSEKRETRVEGRVAA
jgi:uncharacterized Tic20 family protein